MMEDNQKRKEVEEINEHEMMNLMVDGVRKEGLQLSQKTSENKKEKDLTVEEYSLKESKSKNKRRIEVEYEKIFFKRPETNARDGKTVYIRPEFHEKLSRIIQVIGEDKISMYAYLDNLLDYHFIEFGEQITISYNNKHKPIL